MARTIIARNVVKKREKNKFYFIDKQGNVASADMNRKGGKKGRKVSSCGPKKKTAKKKIGSKKKAAPRRSK